MVDLVIIFLLLIVEKNKSCIHSEGSSRVEEGYTYWPGSIGCTCENLGGGVGGWGKITFSAKITAQAMAGVAGRFPRPCLGDSVYTMRVHLCDVCCGWIHVSSVITMLARHA